MWLRYTSYSNFANNAKTQKDNNFTGRTLNCFQSRELKEKCFRKLVSCASRSTSGLGGKERLVTFARYSWHVGMQLLRDVIAYTFAPTCFDEMFA